MGAVLDISQEKITGGAGGSGIIAQLLNLNLKNVYTSSQSVITFTGLFEARSRIGTSDEYYISNDVQSFVTIQEYIDYVKGIYEGAGFTVEQTDTLELTLDSPTDKSYEGFTPIVESRATGFGAYDSALSDDPDFSGGGVSAPQANVLAWKGSNTGENTIPRNYGVKVVSGTYTEINIPAVSGFGTFSVDSDAVNGSGGISSVSIKVGADTVSSIGLNGSETKAKVDAIADIVANAQNGWQISNDGDIITIAEPVGQEGQFEGELISIVLGPGVTFTTSALTAITGGSTALVTSYDFQKNGVTILDVAGGGAIQASMAQMDISKLLSSLIKPAILDVAGDFALPVAVGTLNDFIINISVFGDRV